MNGQVFSLPGPRGLGAIRFLPKVRRDRLGLLQKLFQNYGEVVGMRTWRRDLVILNSHRAAMHVLVDEADRYEKGMGLRDLGRYLGGGLLTNDGASWKKQRQTASSSLDQRATEAWAGVTIHRASQMISRWRACGESATPAEVSSDLDVLSVSIATEVMLGVPSRGEAARLAKNFGKLSRYAMGSAFSLLPWPRWGRASTLASKRIAKLIRRDVDSVFGRAVTARDRGESASCPSGRSMGDMSRDEFASLLFAAYDTTSSTIAWTLQLLSLHREKLKLCVEEIDRVVGDSPVSHGALKRLVYVRAVFSEVFRLFPPVWVIPRRALREDWIAGYRIRPGTEVLISVFSIHRDPHMWEKPDEFSPERFLSSQGRGSYLPFGLGPRNCVGAAVGMLECLATLAVILKSLDPVSVLQELPAPEPLLSLRPRKPIQLIFRPRGSVRQTSPHSSTCLKYS